ncbi:uncharacterized protein LOC112510361 [Cynara cardunculus var. scolymus]|uniref:DUF7866 domain-containing protein n=1 Tax=Cynara cardunculus var. scolymus TaxID=59895 RepID=A0A103YEE6_CYNCS|nr:uncharacterized protein LOC112510361 [Cynara cardunculus var. scolymus]KVI07569.1 hypothetical protein Ccrd_014115 [Cynara cardunculus var. scolymus]
MFINGVLCSLFILLAGIQFSDANEMAVVENSTAEEMTMVPWIEHEKGGMMGLVLNDSRRKLGSFQICSLCTCCAGGGGGGGKGYCLPSPCCYAINCNIPNRPFGFCSFTPKTCNCFRCHL